MHIQWTPQHYKNILKYIVTVLQVYTCKVHKYGWQGQQKYSSSCFLNTLIFNDILCIAEF